MIHISFMARPTSVHFLRLLHFRLSPNRFLVCRPSAKVWLIGFVFVGGMVLACGLGSSVTGPKTTDDHGCQNRANPAVTTADPEMGSSLVRPLFLDARDYDQDFVGPWGDALDLGHPAGALFAVVCAYLYQQCWFPDRIVRFGFLISLGWLAIAFSRYFFEILDWRLSFYLCSAFLAFLFLFIDISMSTVQEKRHLTLFYLSMSIGGALGGVLNSVIAPVLFDDLYEGPLTLFITACVLGWSMWRQFLVVRFDEENLIPNYDRWGCKRWSRGLCCVRFQSAGLCLQEP